MNKCYKVWGTNTLGLPSGWPKESEDTEKTSRVGWIVCSKQEYIALLASLQSDYDLYISNMWIDEKKKELIQAIDDKTDVLLEQGFVYLNKRISLSEYNQTKCKNQWDMRTLIGYATPLIVRIANNQFISFSTEESHTLFIISALAQVNTIGQAGWVEIEKINAMTTVVQLNSYVDGR